MYIVLQLTSAVFIPRVQNVAHPLTTMIVPSDAAVDYMASGTVTVLHDNGGLGYEKKSDALAAMLAYELSLEEQFGVIPHEQTNKVEEEDVDHEEREFNGDW